MPRLSIEDLRKAPFAFRPDEPGNCVQGAKGFETFEMSMDEDRIRIRALREVVEHGSLPRGLTRAAIKLANKLEKAIRSRKLKRTPASSRSMRRIRSRVIGWLWSLVALTSPATIGGRRNPAYFTVMLDKWRYDSRGLCDEPPGRLLNEFSSDLKRLGPNPADGWLFAALHGEFDRETRLFHLHIHGIAAGGMIDRLEQLRETGKYRSEATAPNCEKQPSPIQISKKGPNDEFRRLSYRWQSWWPMNIRKNPVTGEPYARVVRARIMEPYHTEYLLWLDRHRFRDLCLLVGLQVRQGKLVRTGSAYCND